MVFFLGGISVDSDEEIKQVRMHESLNRCEKEPQRWASANVSRLLSSKSRQKLPKKINVVWVLLNLDRMKLEEKV